MNERQAPAPASLAVEDTPAPNSAETIWPRVDRRAKPFLEALGQVN